MNTYRNRIATAVLALAFAAPASAFAGGSAQHFSNAVDHSARGVAHSTAAGAKLVSGAVAVPLMMSGEIGKASGQVGEALWEDANTELPIGEEVITAGPSPAEAMQEEERR